MRHDAAVRRLDLAGNRPERLCFAPCGGGRLLRELRQSTASVRTDWSTLRTRACPSRALARACSPATVNRRHRGRPLGLLPERTSRPCQAEPGRAGPGLDAAAAAAV